MFDAYVCICVVNAWTNNGSPPNHVMDHPPPYSSAVMSNTVPAKSSAGPAQPHQQHPDKIDKMRNMYGYVYSIAWLTLKILKYNVDPYIF